MAMNLYNAAECDGLFQIQGKGFYALQTLNTARLTTVPDEVEDFLAQHELLSGAASTAVDGVSAAAEAWVLSGSVLSGAIRMACEQILIEAVAADAAQPSRSLKRALAYLIDQMETSGAHVEANAVTLSLAADAGNTGDVAIAYTTARGDGRAQENLYAETIDAVVTAAGTAPSITFLGDAAESDRLSQAWPASSGCNTTISAVGAADSLLTNGGFETTTIAHVPDGWIIAVGTPGTSVTVTTPEVQTIAISGTPTGGHYILYWSNAAGITRATAPLAYNASGSAVQTALRAIPGLESPQIWPRRQRRQQNRRCSDSGRSLERSRRTKPRTSSCNWRFGCPSSLPAGDSIPTSGLRGVIADPLSSTAG